MIRQHRLIITLLALSILLAACASPAIAPPTPDPTPEPLVTTGAAVTPSAPPYELTILFTSENHGHWETFQPFGQPVQGGIARRATLIEQIRREGNNLLLLDSGDIAQGSLYFNLYKGAAARDFYNMLGYDAITLGNHEFDFGPQNLADNIVAGAEFDILSANVDLSQEPSLAGKIPAYVVKDVGGERIGLIGVTTAELTDISNTGPNVSVSPPAEPVVAAIAELEAQGVDKIVVLSHQGYANDIALAQEVAGIDVIISGHTDTLLGDPETVPDFLGEPEGPYPTVVEGDAGATLVVHAYIWGRFLGRLDVDFDEQGELSNWDGELIFVGDDPEVADAVEELGEPLEAFTQEVIGQAAVFLDAEFPGIREAETNLANLITDSILWTTANDGTQIALYNGGSIRASINPGDVTRGDVLTTLPFNNEVVSFDLTGEHLLAALENSATAFDPDVGSGRWLHIAGMRVTYDVSLPAGERVVSAEVRNADGTYSPLDPAATYRVATNAFLYDGGDGYRFYEVATNLYRTDLLDADVLVDYIALNSPVSAAVEGRVTVTGR